MKLSQSRDPALDSFENTFKENWPPIYRLLVRMVIDPAEAEDLALETFYRLYKFQNKPQDGSHLKGWLYKVATNLALQSIRKFKRRENYEINAGRNALEEASEDQPSVIVAKQEEQRLVRLALADMNQRQAELLVMRHSGMNYREIAEALRLSPTSIGPLLLRAEREFEKYYRALAKEQAP